MTPIGPGKPRKRVWVCDKCGERGTEKVNIAVRGKQHEASLCSMSCAHAYIGAILAMASIVLNPTERRDYGDRGAIVATFED